MSNFDDVLSSLRRGDTQNAEDDLLSMSTEDLLSFRELILEAAHENGSAALYEIADDLMEHAVLEGSIEGTCIPFF